MRLSRLAIMALAPLVGTACSSDSSGPDGTSAPERLSLTANQISALDSAGRAIVSANPGDADLRALVDSTLLVLSAGVEARRLSVTTNLTSAPLYFVGVHRALSHAGNSWSTWTLVGFDDPAHLTRLVEVAGFGQSASATAPSSMSGTIGDGQGLVNGLLIEVAPGGAVTEWRASAGNASFASDAPGAACPGFVATPRVACSLETMHVTFTLTATGAGSGDTRAASLATTADVPALRLTFTP